MNIVKYLIEHSRTLLNIYFQQGQTVLTPPGLLITPAQATIPTVSTRSRSGLRRSSMDPELQPMTKKNTDVSNVSTCLFSPSTDLLSTLV